VLEEAQLEERLYLPHEGFNRAVGAYSSHHISPDGAVLDQATWETRRSQWLPSDQDREQVARLMVPEYEAGQFAAWIAPPRVGINEQPVEFDYVHLAQEGLA
jgi:benzoyl-CoA 2,3-dioxygenase component B